MISTRVVWGGGATETQNNRPDCVSLARRVGGSRSLQATVPHTTRDVMEPSAAECHAARLAARGRLAAMSAFVMENSNIDSDSDSDSADDSDEWLQSLVRAAHSGDVDRCTRALDDCDSRQVDVNRLTCNGRGSLLAACHAGHAPIVALLMLRGVRASCRGWQDTIPLQLACSEGHIECVRLLLGESDIGDGICDLDGSGSTALLTSCAAGHTDCATLLLERGAGVDSASPLSLETALQAAAERGHIGCAATLLKHGGATDLANVRGSTALHLASFGNHLDIVLMLCVRRADPAKADVRGRTALHVAAHAGCLSVCQALIEQGAHCEAECVLGATPLLDAIENDQPAVAQLLLDLGARTDRLDAISLAELKVIIDGKLKADKDGEKSAASSGDDESDGSMDVAALARALPLAGEPGVPSLPLPPEFEEQVTRMPPLLRRLLVENEDPSSASAAAVLRASGLELERCCRAFRDLDRPAREMLLRVPGALDATACAALRSLVDEAARGWESKVWQPALLRNGTDTVDGLPDWQVNLSRQRMRDLLGDATFDVIARQLPARFDARSSSTGRDDEEAALVPPPMGASAERLPRLAVYQAFVRRYTATTRPWFTFHTDSADLTANIALSADAGHAGGALLGLLEGTVQHIERGEGEATVHPSSLLHGVSRMRGGVRYSLIVFYAEQTAAQRREQMGAADDEDWRPPVW